MEKRPVANFSSNFLDMWSTEPSKPLAWAATFPMTLRVDGPRPTDANTTLRQRCFGGGGWLFPTKREDAIKPEDYWLFRMFPKNWFGCFISTAFLGARVNIFDNIQPELCSGRSCVTTEAWPQKFYLKGRPSTIVEDSSGEVIVQEGDRGNECGSTEELWWVYSEVWSGIR